MRAISGKVTIFLPNKLIQMCYNLAKSKSHKYFAVQSNKECFTTSNPTYDKYGKTTGCSSGRGGGWKNDVYEVVLIRGM